jgi:hypothetical protein
MIKILISISFLLFPLIGTAQYQDPAKTYSSVDAYASFEKKQLSNLCTLYDDKIKSAFNFIIGREHYPYYYDSESKPILYYGEAHTSSITIKDRTYNNFSLNYDTNTDQLIYVDPLHKMTYRPYGMVLNKDIVNNFKLIFKTDTLSFLLFSKHSDPNFNLHDGFYEVVYNGVSKYLIKFIPSIVTEQSKNEYHYSPTGFINTGNGYQKVRTGTQFCQQFGDKSHDVRKYMSKSKIHFRKASKNQIVSVLKYYDGLKAAYVRQ